MVHPLSGYYSFKDANWSDIFSKAEDGDLESIAIGSSILYQGFGLTKVDTKLSRDWLEQGAAIEATEGTDKLCTVMLAVMQAASIGMIGEEEKGRQTLIKHRKWITDEAAQGNAAVMRVLGFMHGRGNMGVEGSVEKAFQLALDGAEKDDPFAMVDVGYAYMGYMEQFASKKSEHLRKIKIDRIEAARYFKKAALLGHSDAQRELGLLITNALANDVSASVRIAERTIANPAITAEYTDLQDMAYGMALLHRSAAQGRIGAMYYLGRAYSGVPAFNNAVPRNVPEAVKWFQHAVNEGFPAAFIELAKLYETWFKDTGTRHDVHNRSTAYDIYDHLLGRPRKPGDTIILSTQPLTPDQIKEVKDARKKLEEDAMRNATTWYRYGNGDRRITFADNSPLLLSPHKDAADPRKDVPTDIQRAQEHEKGDGRVKSYNETYSIYRELLARKEGGEYTLPTADEVKQIKKLMHSLEARADDVIVQPNGNRTLIYKGGFGKPDDIVFAGPKEVPDYKAKKAAAKAAKGAPTRPADTSQTSDKKGDTAKKNET